MLLFGSSFGQRCAALALLGVSTLPAASPNRVLGFAPTQRSGTDTPAQRPKFKAIFEPVNYDQDVRIFSVHCADERSCWAAAGTTEIKGGVILHTGDAGGHWTVQSGDPQSADRAFTELRFVNEQLGFAIQRTNLASNLFRTDDGEHWLPAGKISANTVGYYFASPANGVAALHDSIEVTPDGGKSWKTVATCAAKATVQGLPRNIQCKFLALSFASTSIGYVAARSNETPDNLFLAKTTDGGTTWNILTLDVHDDHPGPEDIFFVSETTGFMRVGGGDTGRIYKTNDGGKSWTAIAQAAGNTMRFSADKGAAWAFRYTRMGFSADGGEHWSSREMRFPAVPLDASLPRANFGMVAGEHGMIYRYRIVPYEFTSKGMLDAPMLSRTPTPQ